MSHGDSIAHAKRIARKAPATCVATARVGGDGRLHAELLVDVVEARLKRNKDQRGGGNQMSWGQDLWVGDLRRAIEGMPDDSPLTATVVDSSGGERWADGLRLEVAGDPRDCLPPGLPTPRLPGRPRRRHGPEGRAVAVTERVIPRGRARLGRPSPAA